MKVSRGQRRFKSISALLSCLWWFGGFGTLALAQPPNIVLILADDLGFTDTAPYGGEIETPNLGRLAEEGVVFTNYHTAATCAPTRAMLLTGVDSHRNGVPNIPEALPPEQADGERYRGTLNHRVVTIATLLRDAGYHTYMTGKWHLGKEPDLLPSRRGFERTVTMADTGSDNWEKKPYLPMYAKANWYADGKEIELPENFYSSEFYVDKAIEFIESNRGDGKPFFSYLAFQAVHIPIQAPREFTDRYRGKYDQGWQQLRADRLQRAKERGIVPADTEMVQMASTLDWHSLSAEEKRYEARKMAVYAGMIEAMDHHIGRLIAHLERTGQYDNTVFVFTSDNGPECADAFASNLLEVAYLKLWMKAMGYRRDYETLGQPGSYINMGPSFASAAATPLAYYKYYAREGGMRVPLIVSGPGIRSPGRLSEALVFVKDIAPTILEIAGVPLPSSPYGGREIEPITGRSLGPLLDGSAERIHADDEAIGYELVGNAALFQGDYKLVFDRGPGGDDRWHLFHIVADPGETKDLSGEMPERFATMQVAYRTYVDDHGVLPVPEGYDQLRAVHVYSIKAQTKMLAPVWGSALVGILLFITGWRWRRHRKKRTRSGEGSILHHPEGEP